MKWKYKININGVNPEKFTVLRCILTVRLSGVINYNAPYTKRQYFTGKSSVQRGRKWVKRMWLSQGKNIIKNANKILNGK